MIPRSHGSAAVFRMRKTPAFKQLVGEMPKLVGIS